MWTSENYLDPGLDCKVGGWRRMSQAKSESNAHVLAVSSFGVTLVFEFSSSDLDIFETKPHLYDRVKNYVCALFRKFGMLLT